MHAMDNPLPLAPRRRVTPFCLDCDDRMIERLNVVQCFLLLFIHVHIHAFLAFLGLVRASIGF